MCRYVVILFSHFLRGLGNCPNGTAWADKAYAIDLAHQLAECSNAGECDRGTGMCKCYDGFTGSACQRSKSFSLLEKR